MKKIIALSQVYWPDTASVSQHLSDLLENLADNKCDVNVISSQFNYENTEIKYQPFEVHENVKIHRVRNTGFGKSSIFARVIDYLTFNILLIYKLIRLGEKGDTVIGLTSPPLVSFVGVIISKVLRMRFVYWTMDLQPELSITAGYLNKNTLAARALQFMGDYIFRSADKIIALDLYMKKHIVNRGGRADIISTIPVWPVMQSVYNGHRQDNQFRIENNFGEKIVIMYSGNHSVVHPLDTLLQCAKLLQNDERFLFVHIGGGVRINDVKQFKNDNDLKNIVLLPYQPREKIHLSLGSADLQVVILGDGCVGYTHPNKIYGSMFIGKPVLYIGPKESHISDCINNIEGNISVRHGMTNLLQEKLKEFASLNAEQRSNVGKNNKYFAEKYFSPYYLIDQMIGQLISVDEQ